ncbi:unnamed protein product [Toxocara canis]|uniref:Dirigent protein n=1 Tax=Toxocara canis TaxID=6265 RepID=A0A183U5N5_TOXCA|nr:unnamed protein product [Toxocara canis]
MGVVKQLYSSVVGCASEHCLMFQPAFRSRAEEGRFAVVSYDGFFENDAEVDMRVLCHEQIMTVKALAFRTLL